jgi:hypothetical protein
MRRLQWLVLLGVVTFASPLAFGQYSCWSYYDPPQGHCTGTGGCEGTYPRTECIIGCISGNCNPSGNYAECCNHSYPYAAGINDGSDQCQRDSCGDIRTHLARSKARTTTEAIATNSKDPLLDYHPPRILFIVSRRTHGYEPFYERDSSPMSKEGM